jgi:MFS transporter, DHA1 family, tetracycline resistance protein
MIRNRTASISFLLVTLLLDTLGIGLIIPVLPRLVASFMGGDVLSASGYYGAFIAIYAVMQFLFAPIIGGLSDRFGRRLVILASLAGAALDYVLLAVAPNLAWLFVGRVVAGITGASFSAANAYIADVTPQEKRAQSFGLIGAAFGLGFIIGPAIGGLVGAVHLRAPFFVAAGLNLVNFLYGVFVLPESLPPDRRRPFSIARANPLASLVNLRRHPVVLGLSGTLVCSFLAQQMLQSIWPLYGDARFGWGPREVGLSLTVVGVMSAFVQGVLVRALIPRIGERRALVLGLLLSVLGFAGFGLATQGFMMYVILVPFALGGVAGPATQALISARVDPSEQGELQGTLASMMSVTAIVGPLVATWLFGYFTRGGSAPYVPGAPYFAAAALNLCGLLLALRLFSRSPVEPPKVDVAVDVVP